MLPDQMVQSILDRRLVHRHGWIAVTLLVARVDQRVQGQRILVRCRYLFLDQAADNACLEWRKLDVHVGISRMGMGRVPVGKRIGILWGLGLIGELTARLRLRE